MFCKERKNYIVEVTEFVHVGHEQFKTCIRELCEGKHVQNTYWCKRERERERERELYFRTL